MKIRRAYRVQLDPNNAQRAGLMQHAGAARFVYNWGLNRKIEAFQAGQKPLSAQKLDGELRKIIDTEYPWLREINSQARQMALANLDAAYQNFFRRLKAGQTGRRAGFPKFKSRKNGFGSFTVFGYAVQSDRVRLPKIGWVRIMPCDESYVPIGGYGKNSETVRFFGARVVERAGHWFLSVQVEEEIPDPQPSSRPTAGLHLGARVLATYADENGSVIEFKNPRALATRMRKMKRLQRSLSRKQPGSKNREKARRRVARLHYVIANHRSDTQHHISNTVTRKSSVVVIEKWDLRRMMGETDDAKYVAPLLADAGLGEIIRQVQYKSAWRGRMVVTAPESYPSSRTCSSCGAVRPGPVAGYEWTCKCSARHDREHNAATNLMKLARSQRDNPNACGENGSGAQRIERETSLDEAGRGQSSASGISPPHPESRITPVGNT